MSPDMVPEIIIVPTGFALAAAVLIIRMWLRHKEKMASLPPGMSPAIASDIADRMGRLEQAVDSIALEVERISEGQRFVTKLLGEPRRQIAEAASELAAAERP